MPDYRLSPEVKHPAHVQDAARALAWLHRNAGSHGIDPDNIFVAGHSAGGHLVSLLAVDPQYLRREGMSPKTIRGVISISGLYDLRELFEPGVLPSRRDEAFGANATVHREASPAVKVAPPRGDLPPFLLTYSGNDLFGLSEQAKSFYSLLLNAGQVVQLVAIPGRDHANVIAEVGRQVSMQDVSGKPIVPIEDLLGPAVIRFIGKVRDGSLSREFHAVWPAGGPSEVAQLGAPPMKVMRNLQYFSGPDADTRLNALDLYLPEGGKKLPILMEVHGGRWRVGDKSGIPNGLVHLFIRQGWAVASVNYRLSPAVKHPTHVQDVARALAWIRGNALHYGLDANRILLFGSSVGGQLVSLLALDLAYLNQEGVPPDVIRGVISTSGIYDVPGWLEPGKVPTGKEQAFESRAAQQEASPIRHLREGAPPFLITFTDRDLYLIPEQSHAFYSAFLKRGLPARLLQIPDRTHFDYSGGAGQPPIALVDDLLGVELVSFAAETAPDTPEF